MTNISEFKAQLRQGGARSNQFKVILNFPAIAAPGRADYVASFLCSAASLPASTIDNLTVAYRGRPVNFGGERSFTPWSVTIINDGDFIIRNALERWSNAVANFESTNGLVNPQNYQVDMSVYQLDRNGRELKGYRFFDAYPTEVGAIALSYETPTIETFDTTFQYNYYKPLDIGGGLGINVSLNL